MKKFELVFGVLLSRWPLVIKPWMFHDQYVVFKTRRAAVVLHDMFVESRCHEDLSKLWRFAEEAMEKET